MIMNQLRICDRGQGINVALKYLQLFRGRLPGGNDPHEGFQIGVRCCPNSESLDNGVGA